jgi:hypothetical protein
MCYISKFLDASKFGYLNIPDKQGLFHRHESRFVQILDAYVDNVVLW